MRGASENQCPFPGSKIQFRLLKRCLFLHMLAGEREVALNGERESSKYYTRIHVSSGIIHDKQTLRDLPKL